MMQTFHRQLARCLAFLVLATAAGFSSYSAANPVKREYTTVELVSEVAAASPQQSFWVGIRLAPADGWHTYWRTPGDSGAPTTVTWDLPPGVEAGPLVWPGPQRIDYGPLANFGYKGPVTLLTRITVGPESSQQAPLILTAHAEWLVCAEICVPEEAELSLLLPLTAGEAAPDPKGGALIAEAQASVPRPVPWEARFAANDRTIALEIQPLGLSKEDMQAAFFFPYEEGVITNAALQTAEWKDQRLIIRTESGFERDLDRVQGVLRLTSGGRANFYEVSLIPAMGAAASALLPPPAAALADAGAAAGSARAGTGLLQALLLALAGGLILNLMPCVFPVLSLKALSIANKAGQDPDLVRREALAFTAGVLLAFAVIGGLLLFLRAGGELIGWGFQLQSPIVVAILAYVLFLVGLNLSGFYTLGGGALSNVGGTLATRPGLSGAFFTGVLATVVATPCTAPFMAAAIGFALLQPAYVTMAVFLAVGLGLAAPLLAFALAPGLQRHLPRPGPWMATLKEFLAFPMYGAAAWLIWVLAQQTGPTGVGAALLGFVLLAFAIWAFKKGLTGRHRVLSQSAAVLSVVLALALAAVPKTFAVSADRAAVTGGVLKSAPFSPAAVTELRSAGRPVFVNFTAAWCITCLLNERVALRSDAVEAELKRAGVAYLKADWTNRDPVITQALQEFNRSGVPLYVLYPAEPEREPLILPQLLTEDILLRALAAL